jgi:DNA-3-methyladenine glycosylase I|tara:strand:- start:1080 stop:1658 length:579 start_codon:yes stop_codon:yes gene_type:complete
MKTKSRCQWCEGDDLYEQYHDEEWGVPVFDDNILFECLILEGAQAGLSWITVLRKREAYRQLFDGFNAKKLARYSDKKLNKILLNPAIIRNRLKVYSVRQNAHAFLAIQQEFGSFSDYLWATVKNKPIQNSWPRLSDLPAFTERSTALSKDLKKRGFNFVGPTIVYAFMQATGMVNDHASECFRKRQCQKMA